MFFAIGDTVIFNLNPQRIRKMYGDYVDKWLSRRERLPDTATRKVSRIILCDSAELPDQPGNHFSLFNENNPDRA